MSSLTSINKCPMDRISRIGKAQFSTLENIISKFHKYKAVKEIPIPDCQFWRQTTVKVTSYPEHPAACLSRLRQVLLSPTKKGIVAI